MLCMMELASWMEHMWWNYVWWNSACWMDILYVCTLLWKLLSYISYISYMFAVKYIYICHIYLWWKLLDLIKNRKKSQYAGSLPSATDGNGLFAVSRRRQRSHVAANCASWELTHLVSLPTVADDKDFAISDRRQRTCHLVTCRWHHTADGKDTRNFAVSGGRQRPAVSHLTDWQRNYFHPLSLPSAVHAFAVRRGRQQSSWFL